jgi:cell division transport system permease protein
LSFKSRALRRSLSDFRRHPWLHAVSISTIVVALLVLGGFFICFRNLENLADRTSPQVTGTVYLKATPAPEALKELNERFLALERVRKVTYKPKAAVVEELHGFLGSAGGTALPGGDLFPDVVEIELEPNAPASHFSALTEIISRFPEVAEVDFSEDWLAQYKRVRSFIGGFGLCLMIAVILGCAFITANFMGIRYQSRRDEIDIVRLIGATRSFVLKPFLIEGAIEGAIGALLALIVLAVGSQMVSALFTVQWGSVLGVDSWLFLSLGQGALLVLIGVAIACLGSITVFLRFKEPGSR